MPLRDIMQMMQMMGQIQTQQRGLDLQQQQQRMAAYGDFARNLQNIVDPTQIEAYTQAYAKDTGLSADALRNFATHRQVGSDVINAYTQQQGWAQAQGNPNDLQTPEAQNLARQSATRNASGMSTAELARSNFAENAIGQVANPQTDFTRALNREFTSAVTAGMNSGQVARSGATASRSMSDLALGEQYGEGIKQTPQQLADLALGRGHLGVAQGNLGVAQGQLRLGQQGQIMQGAFHADEMNAADQDRASRASLEELQQQTQRDIAAGRGTHGGADQHMQREQEQARKDYNRALENIYTKPLSEVGRATAIQQARQALTIATGNPHAFDTLHPDLGKVAPPSAAAQALMGIFNPNYYKP